MLHRAGRASAGRMDERRAVFHAEALLPTYKDQRSAAHRPASIDRPYRRLACKNGVAQSKRNVKLSSGRMQKYFDGLALFLRNTIVLRVPFEDQLRKIREFIADLPFYPNATLILILIMDKQIRIRKLIVFVHVFNDQTKDVCNVFVHILFSILFSLAEGAVIETDALYGHTPLSRRVANLSRSPSMGAAMRFELIPPEPQSGVLTLELRSPQWVRGWDSNPRLPGYEPGELPTATTPQHAHVFIRAKTWKRRTRPCGDQPAMRSPVPRTRTGAARRI